MKSEYNFSPDLDWGPGSESVHRILAEWASIDWFERPGAGEAEATDLFRGHHALTSSLRPDLVSATTQIRTVSGDWSELRALAEYVRHEPFTPPKVSLFARLKARALRTPNAAPPVADTWDWKHGILKKMSRDHWKKHGWSPDDHAHDLREGRQLDGEFFLRVPGLDTVIWNAPMPKLDLTSKFTEEADALAQWYLGYATVDVIDAAAWQLAQGADALEGNPFVSLIRCYAAGYLPVALSAEDWVLFSFRENPPRGTTPRGF